MPLSSPELRVLGSLIEKALTTPEYYPLSLSALTNACNQLTSRDPVVKYGEDEVARAIDGLREQKLASAFHGAESRVPKYKHLLNDAFLLTPAEVAILCVLMLRGPQTVGELRTRAERMHRFDSLAEVEETLQALATHTPQPLAAKLPRQPGEKDNRYTQLLSGPVSASVPAAEPPPGVVAPAPKSAGDRLAALEEETAALRREVAEIKQQLGEFRKQFE